MTTAIPTSQATTVTHPRANVGTDARTADAEIGLKALTVTVIVIVIVTATETTENETMTPARPTKRPSFRNPQIHYQWDLQCKK
jgi:hypothetical protein